jgi:hypothetical protein
VKDLISTHTWPSSPVPFKYKDDVHFTYSDVNSHKKLPY